jgi:hypothetical protein
MARLSARAAPLARLKLAFCSMALVALRLRLCAALR